MIKRNLLNFLVGFAAIASQAAYAQSAPDVTEPTEAAPALIATPTSASKEEDPDKGLPKSGVLSSTYSDMNGALSKSVPMPWSKKDASATDIAPLGGSISRLSQQHWKIVVTNNSEDEFNATVVLKQLGARGDSVKSDSFSFRLKAKESAERTVSAVASSSNALLELSSWKRIVKAKPK